MTEENNLMKIGSRKSELALIQTNCVMDSLKQLYPDKNFEIVTMSTLGDEIIDRPLPKIGEKSLFTKELEIALVEGKVDLVVHSLKDMPTALPPCLAIGAITKREDPRDAVILHSKHRGLTLGELPKSSLIGTSSLRRTAQLKKHHPDLVVESIRGNLQTRLRKLDQGQYDGIVLALAGITRMGWEHRISQVLDEREMLWAVGQGALAVECRADESTKFSMLSDKDTVYCCLAERALLMCLGAGCSAPVAVSSSISGDNLSLTAGVWTLDASKMLKESLSVDLSLTPESLSDKSHQYCGFSVNGRDAARKAAAHRLGCDLASRLIKLGALDIIATARKQNEES